MSRCEVLTGSILATSSGLLIKYDRSMIWLAVVMCVDDNGLGAHFDCSMGLDLIAVGDFNVVALTVFTCRHGCQATRRQNPALHMSSIVCLYPM